jgi:hypothetical protein
LKVLDIALIVGYGMSGLMAVVGVLVLSGILALEGLPVQLRLLFGAVLIVYSVYRFMMTRTRAKQAESSDE